MVLIISDSDDQATNEVIKWLLYYGIDYIRICDKTLIKFVKLIPNQNFIVEYMDINKNIKEIDLYKITGFWYRRGDFEFDISNYTMKNENRLNKFLNNYLNYEINIIHGFVYDLFANINSRINNMRDNYLNKLNVLELAKKCKIDVPNTFILTKKNELIRILNIESKLLTKAIFNTFSYRSKSLNIIQYSSIIDKKNINKIPKIFFPTLFQEYIDKKFELRIFFLNGKFFTSAIFSQNDTQTRIDFRNYNFQKLNRTPPYKLPKILEKKLLKLFNLLRMTSGSVDIIYSTNNKYYFLEINPIGQFHQVSYPCNYFLFREIARNFINSNINEYKN